MKRSLLTAFAAALLGAAALHATPAEPAPVFLVHSCPGFTTNLATRLGAVATPAGGVLTAERLAGARVLAINGPTEPFTAAECAAVRDFLQHGGSLLIIVDDSRRQPRAREIANPLLTTVGMEFTEDVPYVHNVGAVAEPGAINRATRELPYSGGRAVTGGTPFSRIMDTGNLAHAAYVETPSGGRVVALAEGMVALGLGKPEGVRLSGVPYDPAHTTYWGKDSETFMQEVLAWLLHR